MPFMEPEFSTGDWYEIETRDGSTSWVPADLAGNPAGLSDGETITADDDCDAEWAEARSAVIEYCDGEPSVITYRVGWIGARLSAPGYMDATEWSAFETEGEAREYLAETYEVCPDCGERLPGSDERGGEDVCVCDDEATLAALEQQGFDDSARNFADGGVTVRCSQCEVVCINGIACHERGCPNTPAKCRECGSECETKEQAAECCYVDDWVDSPEEED